VLTLTHRPFTLFLRPSFFYFLFATPSFLVLVGQILDARVPDGLIREWVNQSPVSSTYMFRHADYLMTADQQGVIKTWETGSGRVVHQLDTGTHIRVALMGDG
jgi:hypothetical protein